jgi:hypothetical protein
VVSLAHVWAFGNPHWLAERLPAIAPSGAAIFGKMSLEELEMFAQAAVEYLRERQGDGHFGSPDVWIIAVGTKAAA